MATSPFLDGLNPEQRRAVATVDGPLLILAGAGSGKTRVLTHRIAHMLSIGVRPGNMLAVTFTNKAANEMKARVARLVGDVAGRLWVSTFHSACVRLLRFEAEAAGLPRQFVIWDDDDQQRLLKQLVGELGIDEKKHPPGQLRGKIDQYKNRLIGPEEILRDRLEPAGGPVLRVFRAYEDRLALSGAVDFNDIIGRVVKLLESDPAALARWQDRFRYVMVDEYQDTNHAQYRLIRRLTARDRNLAVVGDDDQSIYRFRGADISNILSFEKDFPEAAVVKLERNYRSKRTILEAATAIVRNNTGRKDKTMWTEADPGPPIRLLIGEDSDQEAWLVVEALRERLRRGRQPQDLAIIYRTNATSLPFEKALRAAKVPYVLVGARKFYDRREVKDILAYLRLVVNPADDMSLLRVVNVPRRGLGAKALTELQAQASAAGVPLFVAAGRLALAGGRAGQALGPFVEAVRRWQALSREVDPPELVRLVVEESGYRAMVEAEEPEESANRLANLDELVRDAASPPEGAEDPSDALGRLQAFLDRVSLAGQDEELPDEGGRVTLLTAHLAKGLEFPVVFVVNATEGAFPHQRASDDPDDLEEERRLVYVAFTRAEEELLVSYARRRLVPGRGFEPAFPSRFLLEVPSGCLDRPVGGLVRGPRGPGQDPAASSRLTDLLRQVQGPGDAPAPVRPRVAVPAGPMPRRPAASEAVRRTVDPEEVARRGFRAGMRVVHPQYGLGEVRQVSGAPSNPRLEVLFEDGFRRTVFARIAMLDVLDD